MNDLVKHTFFKYLTILMVVLAGTAVFAQGGSNVTVKLTDEDSGLVVLDQDRNGLTVRMDIGNVAFIPVSTAHGNFILPQIKGFTRSFNYGDPTLPVASGLLDIPFDCSLNTRIIDSEVKEIKLTDYGLTDPLFPVQPSLAKSQDHRNVPFRYNRPVYESKGKYSLPLANAEVVGTMRDTHIGRVAVAPFEYYPSEKKLTVYTSVTVKITYDNSNWKKTRELKSRYRSAYFDVVRKQLLNYQKNAAEDDLVKYPIKYLIIADRMFEAQLVPFIQWKTKKGFKVVVAYTDTIGSTTTSIKNYIQTQYNNGTAQDPAPSFVLFVGDAQQIPPFSGSAGSHITDLRYCEFTGDDIPEIYYGRFSAQNTAQLQPQIDKTLEYEQYTMPDPSYLGEVTLISGVDSGYASTYGNGQINYGTNLYFNAAHGIAPNVWLYPASDGSGVPAAIKQTVNDGVGFLNYTAHCSHTGMADPSFTTSDIPSLTNAHKYLLGIGNCCLSNTFGTDYGTPCFGEAWLQAENKGGIGWIGGSNSTYWDEDYWFGVGSGPIVSGGPTYAQTGLGAYDGVFHDHGEPVADQYVTNGGIIFCGNMAVVEAGSSRTKYYWEIYHLMGDPSVMTYMGVPGNNSVSHPASLTPAAASVTVSASPGSYVGISRNNVLHGAGYVGTSGSVLIALTPFGTGGAADIVVTCQDKKPYVSTISVIAGTDPPTAGFTASPVSGPAPLTVHFTDQSVNTVSWSWNFGDSGTSTQSSPSHIYNTPGTYTVVQTVTNDYGTDSMTRTNYITVTEPQIDYCDSYGEDASLEWISGVTVGPFSNTSGTDNGYGDYTGQTVELTAGSTYNVTLTPEFLSTIYTEYWKIWIDYNRDGDFDDIGEEVFSATGTAAVNGSFSVPAGLAVTTRMRVSMKWNSGQTSSCEVFSYGEVEDYTVNISSGREFSDFNKDGKPDLLWRNYVTGKNVIWFMDNTTRTGYQYLNTTVDLNWKIDAIGDMNNDGNTDIIWRNYGPGDGRTAVWYMNGPDKIGSAWFQRTYNLDWKIVGTGDFNGDGHTDIVWRYDVDGVGKNLVWYMNGVTKTGHAYFNPAANCDWKIESVNDFNGDGKPDLLWRLYADPGYIVIWYMDNATKTGHDYLPRSINYNWKIEGTGDFNGDGQTDIIWRNYGTGDNLVWYMNGATKTGHAYFTKVGTLSWDIENN